MKKIILQKAVIQLMAGVVMLVSGTALWAGYPVDNKAKADTTNYEVIWRLSMVRVIDLSQAGRTVDTGIPFGVAGWDVTYCIGGRVDLSGNCNSQTKSTVKEEWRVNAWSALGGLRATYNDASYCATGPSALGGGISFTARDVPTGLSINGASLLDQKTYGALRAAVTPPGSPADWPYIAYERNGNYSLAIYCRGVGNKDNGKPWERGFITQLPMRWKVTGTVVR